MVAGRGLWHSPIDDPVRRTSEKLVGPYLPRPFTSPSCGTPRHPAPTLTRVGCERVSGTTIETLGDDLDDILLKLWIVKRIKKSFTVQERDTAVPAQPRVVKRVPLRRHRATVDIRGWAARPPDAFMRLARETHEPGGLGEVRRNPTLWPLARDLRGVGRDGGEAAAEGGGLRSDYEMSLCSSSSAVASALDKRSYRRITGPAEGTTSAVNGCGESTGRRTRRGDASAGD